jgi:soluble lytic murein transglycosylase-like protein
MKVCSLLVCLLPATIATSMAQTPPAKPEKSIRATMEESIARQRESVRRQVKAVPETGSGWYTVPWTREDDIRAIQPITPMEPAETSPEEAAPAPAPATQASWRPDCLPMTPGSLDGHINLAASREGYSPNLLRAVIEKESAFYPCAVSGKGAMGLMQLMPATASELGVNDPFDPLQNLYGGARYLGRLLTRYQGDVGLALGAYNAGPGKVDSFGGVPAYPETKNFVRGILGILGFGQTTLD